MSDRDGGAAVQRTPGAGLVVGLVGLVGLVLAIVSLTVLPWATATLVLVLILVGCVLGTRTKRAPAWG